jgi:hypothetical protein
VAPWASEGVHGVVFLGTGSWELERREIPGPERPGYKKPSPSGAESDGMGIEFRNLERASGNKRSPFDLAQGRLSTRLGTTKVLEAIGLDLYNEDV